MGKLFDLLDRTQEDDLAQALRDGAPEEVILKMIASPTLKGSWVNIGKEYISPIATENFIYLATTHAPKDNPYNRPCYSLNVQQALINKGSDVFWDFPIQARHYPYTTAIFEGFIRGVYPKRLVTEHKVLDYHRLYDNLTGSSYYALKSLYPLFEAIKDEDTSQRYSFNFLTASLAHDAYLPTKEDLENLLEFRPEFLRKQTEGSFDNIETITPYTSMTFEPLDVLLYKECTHPREKDDNNIPIAPERINSLDNQLKLMKMLVDQGANVTEVLFQKYLDNALKKQRFEPQVSQKVSALLSYKLHLTDETYKKMHKYLRAQSKHQDLLTKQRLNQHLQQHPKD